MEIHSEKVNSTNKMHKLTTDEYRNHSKRLDTVLCESGCELHLHQQSTVKYPEVWTVITSGAEPSVL